jgi:PilZ domain
MTQDTTEAQGSTQDRRRFKRIDFDARTTLSQGDSRWEVTLLDLSLKGLLVAKPDDWNGQANEPFKVNVQLGPDAPVNMDAELKHDNDGQLGFQCTHIDLDSISHLRRLVELNLGDEGELERELSALIH